MASKSKSGLFETPSKSSPATPTRVSKLSRGVSKSEHDSTSPLQNSRLSVDRSPRSINSKPTIDRRSPKVTTVPEQKPHGRVVKGSELQAQLSQLQEELKKAKEQIASIEIEKAKALDELREAQKVSEEATEKLREALMAQKRAEEDSEIEKFRALELEQVGIDDAHKKEEEWVKEVESVRNQHALDVASLLSTTQEVQWLKQELAMTSDAKNQALAHADDATKIAEIHADKVEILSSELTRLKALLDSKRETEFTENSELLSELEAEIDVLKQSLEKSRSFEKKLIEREGLIEQLNVDLEAANMAESYARNLVLECKTRVEELEIQVEEANRSERSASESLNNAMKQLERNNDSLHNAEDEIEALKEKVGLLEMTTRRQREDLEKSERRSDLAKEETVKMAKMIDSLKTELENVNEEKEYAMENEKLAAASVQSLLKEKSEILSDLESSREEEEKSKKVMESLTSALHEISAEARETKEKLLSNQVDHENYETQIEDLKLVVKATNEKYESMLDEANHGIDVLTNTDEQLKNELMNCKAKLEMKEVEYNNCVDRLDKERTSLETEMIQLASRLKDAEHVVTVFVKEEAELKDNLKEVEAEVIYLQENLGKSKAETMKLKESLFDKDAEIQSYVEENEELRRREEAAVKEIEELRAIDAASVKKVEEMSRLLEEAMTTNKQTQENGEVTDSEKDYDLLPKVVEFSEENGHGSGEEKTKLGFQEKAEEEEENVSKEEEEGHLSPTKVEYTNGNTKEDVKKEKAKEKDVDSVDIEYKMWESCKIEKKEASPERESKPESIDEEVDSKVETGDNIDQINGLSSSENIDDSGNSPTKQMIQPKKKKPLLRKFGNLLKKKTSSTSQK